MSRRTCAVVGGGIRGSAVANRLCETGTFEEITLFEKEDGLARHQTGRVTVLRNAPSPAATSSLAIAAYLVSQIRDDRTGVPAS